MSFVAIVFRGSDFAASDLYTFNGCTGAGAQYVADSLPDAVFAVHAMAAHLGSGRVAGYAVFPASAVLPIGHDLTGGRVPAGFLPGLVAPVYVPAHSAALARHYGWPVGYADGWGVPNDTLQVVPARVAIPAMLPAEAAPVARWPIDPSGPVELEDGTPCRVTGESMQGRSRIVRVAPLREPVGEYPRHWGDGWWHEVETGDWAGDTSYLRVRNAGATVDRLPEAEAPDDVPCASPAPVPAPAVRFEVRSGLNGTDRDTWSSVADFDNGKEAGAWVAAHKADYAANGKSLAIVRVELAAAPVVDWREREAERLRDGTYAPLPGDWASLIARAYPDHFPHVANSDKRKVAFTETDSAGERDRQKVLSAAAYVERFFRGSGDSYWARDMRQRFVSDMLGESLSALITPLGDVGAMVQAYRDSDGGDCSSCMSHATHDYDSGGLHPVSVYAMGGEIAVAYLRGWGDDRPEGERWGALNPDATADSRGPILARCLVWIKDGENRQYGRVYGCAENARMLRTALEARGFRQGDLYGARIAKVPHGSGWVMPYLDIGEGSVSDCGDYWEAGGNLEAQNTCGCFWAKERRTCESCDDSYHEDDMREVYVSDGDTESWCYHCASNYAFHCDELQEYAAVLHAADLLRDGARYSVTVADWLLYDGTIDAVQDSDGCWIENGEVCDGCGEVGRSGSVAEVAGDDSGECLCTSCASDREDEIAEREETDSGEEETDSAAIAA